MKAIIVEDEYIAAQVLQRMLQTVAPEVEVLTVLQGVEESIEWFQLNPMPELVFLDIHLADGTSFSIIEKVNITCPVIFTTAYDEYALKAFELNSIDYLLKPISQKHLERAMNKLSSRTSTPAMVDSRTISEILSSFRPKNYKSNLLVPQKDKLIPLSVDKIACFYTENKAVYALMVDGKKFTIDSTLDEISEQVDPEKFFRANRQYIIAHKSVVDISMWFGSKVSVNLSVETPERIIVSKARVTEFKHWFTK